MVVTTLLLTLVALGDAPSRPLPSVALQSQAGGAPAHLVVPTGTAVPLVRRYGARSSSDLFKTSSVAAATGSAVVAREREISLLDGAPKRAVWARLCHL